MDRTASLSRFAFSLPGIIFLLALAVRLLHLFPFAAATPFFDPAPWHSFENPLDTGSYDRWGQQILAGDGWWMDNGQGEYFQSPAYPYFVALIYALAGRSLLSVGLVQAILGAATCMLTALMARRLFTPAAGWLAGLAAVFYGPAIFYGSFLLKETVVVFLVTAAMTASLTARSRRALFSCGLLWGMAVAFWPLLAPVALATAAWIPWRGRPEKSADHPAAGRVVPAALLAAGMLLAILPVTVRNMVAEERFVLISDSGPRNWEVGNSSNSSGTYMDYPGERLPLSSGRFWMLQVQKAGLFFHPREIPQIVDHELLRKASPVLGRPLIGFAFVAPLALAGWVLLLRRWRDLFPLLALSALYPLSVSLFFVVGRFRLPVIPTFLILAAGAATWLMQEALEHRAGRLRFMLVASGIVLAGFLIGANQDLPRGSYPFHHTWARYHLDRAQVLARNGDKEGALLACEQAGRVALPDYRDRARRLIEDISQ